jgi:MFS family permease
MYSSLKRSAGGPGENTERDGARLAAGWTMVGIFLFFYTFSFIDRTIISMMVAPIQRDLHLSEFQISLLLGPAFGLFYVLCGLPMGVLVDRLSRRWLTVIGVSVWGLATAFCGIAGSYVQLFIARMGVGVGESALTPSAHSMIAEHFGRKNLSTAMSVFTLGAVIGGGIAMAAGGVIVHLATKVGTVHLPFIGAIRAWQLVFGIMGLATLATAPLALIVREKPHPRFTSENVETPAADGFRELLRRHWVLFIGAPVGFGFINSISQAYTSWVPTFMVRSTGWNIGQVGVAAGVQHLVTGTLGFVGSAMIVDRLYAGGMTDAHTRYPIMGLFLSVPLAVWGFHVHDPILFLVLNSAFYLSSYGWIGYAAASLQLFTPPHLRGRVAALLLAIATVIGTGLGAPTTAFFTDVVFKDRQKIGLSLSVVTVIFAVLSILVLFAASRKMQAMHTELDATPAQSRH